MRAALTIGFKDLRQRLRDRSALVLAFVAPVALATIISLAFGGLDGIGLSGDWVVADEDGSELSRAFTEEVLAGIDLGEIEITPVDTAAEAEALVTDDRAQVGFVIPAGFEADVQAGAEARMTVLRNPSSTIGYQVAEAIGRAFTDQVAAARLSVLTAARAAGEPPDQDTFASLAREATEARIPVVLADAGVGTREITGANYFGPAMAIFFLFFTVGFGARSLIAERQAGTLPRLLAAPVSRLSVIAGKGVAVFVLGLASMATMFVFMGVVFGAQWGDPVALTVLAVVTVAAVLGVTAVVQTLARTEQQADSYGSMVAISFALLGGNFFPIHQTPELMQRLSLLTPNGWALRGFTDLVYDDAALAAVLPNVAAVMAFAVVCGGVAFVRARRMTVA